MIAVSERRGAAKCVPLPNATACAPCRANHQKCSWNSGAPRSRSGPKPRKIREAKVVDLVSDRERAETDVSKVTKQKLSDLRKWSQEVRREAGSEVSIGQGLVSSRQILGEALERGLRALGQEIRLGLEALGPRGEKEKNAEEEEFVGKGKKRARGENPLEDYFQVKKRKRGDEGEEGAGTPGTPAPPV